MRPARTFVVEHVVAIGGTVAIVEPSLEPLALALERDPLVVGVAGRVVRRRSSSARAACHSDRATRVAFARVIAAFARFASTVAFVAIVGTCTLLGQSEVAAPAELAVSRALAIELRTEVVVVASKASRTDDAIVFFVPLLGKARAATVDPAAFVLIAAEPIQIKPIADRTDRGARHHDRTCALRDIAARLRGRASIQPSASSRMNRRR